MVETKTPKNRFDDETTHDPSQQYYDREFNDIARQHDAVADPARENENIRKLRAGEKEAGSDVSTADSVRDAESNPFDYPTGKVEGSQRSGKKGLIGGGIVVGLIISAFLGFGMLLPLKIPALLNMIANEAAQRVEEITEKRAKVILGRAIVSKFATNSGVVVTGNGAVATLIASMRTNGFEKRLAAKGLVIEKSGDGVKLKMNGKPLGGGKSLKNEVAIVKALEADGISNRMLKDVIKEDIPSWRWMKRAKFAKWLRIKYAIPRYGVKNSDEPDQEKRVSEMQKERMQIEYEALAQDIGEGTECIMTAECDVDTQDESRPADTHESGDAGAVRDSVSDTVDDVVDNNSGPPGSTVRKTLLKMVIDKLGTKAIPIIGWIDLLATADHIAHKATEDDYFGKLAAYYRARQEARHYGTWEGYASQIQLGGMDPAFIAELAKQTEGVEESQAFNYIQGDPSKGEKVEKIGSNSRSDFADQLTELRKILAPASNIPGVQKSTHFVLNLYYETIGGGGLLGWVSGLLGDFLASLSSLLTPDAFEDWFAGLMVKVGEKLFEVIGLDFDPGVEGAAWFNAAHGGATWTYNDFCQNEMGCRKLSADQASIQNRTIAAERADYRNDKGLLYALFNQEDSQSLTNQLAVQAPTDVTSSATSLAKLIFNTPATLAGIATNKTFAGSKYVDIHGVDPYGATQEELGKPVDPKAISGEPCDETFDGNSLNLCQTDTMVAEAMLCEFEPESEECGEDIAPSATTGEGLEFTVGSYNILHSVAHTAESMAIGGCNANPVPGDPRCAKTRADLQIKIFRGEAGNPPFDVVGTQETSPEQYNYIKQTATDYDAFPEDASRMENQLDGATAIWWRKDVFTKFASGKYRSLSNVLNRGGNDGKITQPWVGLQAGNGQKIYVTSVHFSNATFGGTPEKMRESAQYAVDWIKTVVDPEAIVFVVGDFNDKLSEKLTYCVMTQDAITMHARDLANNLTPNPNKPCPAPNNNGASIDHIYLTPTAGVEVDKWLDMPRAANPMLQRASDHTPVYAKITIPGTGEVQMNVATFNIYHSDDAIWRERLRRSVDVLKSNNIDVAGLQETRQDQNQLFRTSEYGGDTYDMFPKTVSGADFSPNPIIWNKDKFELVKTYYDKGAGKVEGKDYLEFLYFGGTPDRAPWVKLRDKASGQEFYFINTHDPADANGPAAELRWKNAKHYAEFYKNLSKEGLPIFFTGDFNSGYEVRRSGNDTYQYKRENLTYCIVTDNTGLWDAYDAAIPKNGKCPTTNYNPPGGVSSPGIDHIFLSTDVGVSKYFLSPAGKQKNGSDVHPTVMATVNIAGPAGPRSSGAWAWPIGKAAWATDGQRWLESHTTISDAWTNSIKAASDMNIGSGNSDCGKPVYSMLGGKVVTNPPRYTMQVISTVNGKEVLITYAHGSNMKGGGTTVKSGQQIMTINSAGTTGSCHLHLEIKYGDKPICPQKIFPLMAQKTPIDLSKVPAATFACG